MRIQTQNVKNTLGIPLSSMWASDHDKIFYFELNQRTFNCSQMSYVYLFYIVETRSMPEVVQTNIPVSDVV